MTDADSLAPLAWLGTYWIHSTLLLGCAWLVARGLRSVRAREWTWRTALVGGLLTASLQTAMGFDPLLGRLELPAPSTVEGTVRSVPVTVSDPGATPSGRAKAVPQEQPAQQPWHWTRWLLVTWIAGGLGGGLLLLVAGRRLNLVLRGVRPCTDPALLELLEDLRRRAGLRRPVRLLVGEHLSAPIALGSLRPQVVLPPRVVDELPKRLQEPVLAHELAHLARFDPLWMDLCRVLETVLFVQPLQRVARRALARCAEFRCDDRAVELTHDRIGLARCLVQVARWIDGESTQDLPACGMADLHSPLAERVRRVLEDGARQEPRGRWAALGVALLASGTFLAAPGVAAAPRDPWPDARSPQAGPTTRATAQAIARTLELLRASADELDARLEALLEDARARDLDPATSRSIEALAGRVERVRGRAERVQTLADLWTQLTDTSKNP